MSQQTAPASVSQRNFYQGLIFDDLLPAVLAFKHGDNPNQQLSAEGQRYSHYYGPESDEPVLPPQFGARDLPPYAGPALAVATLGILYLAFSR